MFCNERFHEHLSKSIFVDMVISFIAGTVIAFLPFIEIKQEDGRVNRPPSLLSVFNLLIGLAMNRIQDWF
jgi:hypothetical protein